MELIIRKHAEDDNNKNKINELKGVLKNDIQAEEHNEKIALAETFASMLSNDENRVENE